MFWILLSWSLPLFGPLFYLAIGVNRVPEKAFKKHAADQKLLAEREAKEEGALPLAYWRAMREASLGRPENESVREFDRAVNSILSGHPLLGGNRISVLATGDEAYPRMLSAIKSARGHIHCQSFIVRNDAVGREFLDAMAGRARAGVVVRLMYDRFGSSRALLTGLFRRYRRVPNMQITGWTQANPMKRQLQINLRNHRKIMVIDGRQAFCGGMNIGSQNVSDGVPAVRDYHLEITGPVVQELQYTFVRDWYFMTEEDPDKLLCGAHFPRLPAAGPALIRIANSGPTSAMETLTDVFFMAIASARRRILIATAYFVPPQDIVRALRAAALRGVDVRIIVPEKSNHVYAGYAGRARYDELLASGVRVFEREPPFMHAKGCVVDDSIAIVGTANLDVRSLRLNYETDLIVYDDGFVNDMKRVMLVDLSRSVELSLDSWRRRSTWQRVAENLCYLMTPEL